MHLPLTDNQVKLLRRVAESTTVADAAIPWLLHLIADPDAVLLSDLGLEPAWLPPSLRARLANLPD